MGCSWTFRNVSTTSPGFPFGVHWFILDFRRAHCRRGLPLLLRRPVDFGFETLLVRPCHLTVASQRAVLCPSLAWPWLTGCWTGGSKGLKSRLTCAPLWMTGEFCSVTRALLTVFGLPWNNSLPIWTWQLTWARLGCGQQRRRRGGNSAQVTSRSHLQLAIWVPTKTSVGIATMLCCRSGLVVCPRFGLSSGPARPLTSKK